MIPNFQPYVAVVRERKPNDLHFDMLRYLPIVAWREDGTALAVHNNQLLPVSVIPGYERIAARSINHDGITGTEVIRKVDHRVKGRDPRQAIRTNLTEESK